MTPLYSINQKRHMGYFGYQFDHYVVTIMIKYDIRK